MWCHGGGQKMIDTICGIWPLENHPLRYSCAARKQHDMLSLEVKLVTAFIAQQPEKVFWLQWLKGLDPKILYIFATSPHFGHQIIFVIAVFKWHFLEGIIERRKLSTGLKHLDGFPVEFLTQKRYIPLYISTSPSPSSNASDSRCSFASWILWNLLCSSIILRLVRGFLVQPILGQYQKHSLECWSRSHWVAKDSSQIAFFLQGKGLNRSASIQL